MYYTDFTLEFITAVLYCCQDWKKKYFYHICLAAGNRWLRHGVYSRILEFYVSEGDSRGVSFWTISGGIRHW